MVCVYCTVLYCTVLYAYWAKEGKVTGGRELLIELYYCCIYRENKYPPFYSWFKYALALKVVVEIALGKIFPHSRFVRWHVTPSLYAIICVL